MLGCLAGDLESGFDYQMTVVNNSPTSSPGYQIFCMNKSYTFFNYTSSQGYLSSFFVSGYN